MAIQVALHHQTIYRYDRPVTLSPHVVRLRPAPHCRTPILSYSLTIEPRKHFINWQQDPYSNYLARLVFPNLARELVVEVDLVADLITIDPFDFFIEDEAEYFPFTYDAVLARELIPYRETEPAGPRMQHLIDSLRTSKIRSVDYLVDLNRHVQQAIRYIIRMEPGIQTCEETLTMQSGSCRDSAWVLVQLLRHLGFAARFVSGYLIQLAPDVRALDGPGGPVSDFTDLHAWTEVYLPGAGWVGLDPTSGLLAGEGHLPLACAADPITAAPITGTFGWARQPGEAEDACQAHFDFKMSVTRLPEVARVTRPYTEEQWQAIDTMGERIDRDLEAGDVRLTMGGEPTFVSIDDMDGAEWTVAALGPTKRQLAGNLLKRLRERFAPRGVLLYSQGKWYPGEPLPRWALSCHWRVDGEPVWHDGNLIADEARDYGHGPEEARRFLTALCGRLGVDANHILPSYEDVWYYLWRERRLPVNVDPLRNRLDNEQERMRLARIFEQGLSHVVGHVLPLERRRFSPARWISGRWFLRQEHLFLMPGDSPMGLRLPLDSLPWFAPEKRDPFEELDPFAPRAPLSAHDDKRQQAVRPAPGVGPNGAGSGYVEQTLGPRPGENGEAGADVIRTALCIEPRAGRLHVFLPPQRYAEDFLDLVAAIEETARALQLPVILEGYSPPYDPRLHHFSITPDPGVIEVNIHPAHNWRELVEHTTTLYEEARLARLGTEKFMLDGRHTGTGGGNHILLGGPTPADSPLLRRPDLLRSLIGFWHNHPALSYLFSGLFVGPTSQAPRIDEARNDSVYEMELAFRQIPDHGAIPFWLVDRVFRHLLVDVTGNTHRAEFCIDKLYSPDTASGRRGLVELRAFEMPPHSRMSLVQHLLLRALVAQFWKTPYRQSLVRWGTELHDRFLLPHFVAQDFADVLEELKQGGYELDPAWFAPHFEFRFPLYGKIEYRDLVVELRQAIEPWPVLGEEPAGGATARFVDSSLERVQVKVQGLTDPRHVLTCNQHRIPLHPTGVKGEYVAGVRYRAWQPPSCLHPTIPVQVPLIFDILDLWLKRSVGGCRYYVEHPGGRAVAQFPVNALAAEARRVARFLPHGYSPGPIEVPPLVRNPDMPLTLDLREASTRR